MCVVVYGGGVFVWGDPYSKVRFGVFFFRENVRGRNSSSSLVSFAPRRSRVEEKLNSRDAHSLEFSETDGRALKQLCYTSFTARVRIILPVYRVELMLHLGKLGPV